MKICEAVTRQQIGLIRTLFEEYAAWLGIGPSFQGFAAELAGLPGAYVPPRGRLLLAVAGDEAAGCVALRPLDDNVCEMKRLFVRSRFRGRGTGRLLAERVVEEARASGYRTIRLNSCLPCRLPSGFTRRLDLPGALPTMKPRWQTPFSWSCSCDLGAQRGCERQDGER